jgi:hypothetical protein
MSASGCTMTRVYPGHLLNGPSPGRATRPCWSASPIHACLGDPARATRRLSNCRILTADLRSRGEMRHAGSRSVVSWMQTSGLKARCDSQALDLSHPDRRPPVSRRNATLGLSSRLILAADLQSRGEMRHLGSQAVASWPQTSGLEEKLDTQFYPSNRRECTTPPCVSQHGRVAHADLSPATGWTSSSGLLYGQTPRCPLPPCQLFFGPTRDHRPGPLAPTTELSNLTLA